MTVVQLTLALDGLVTHVYFSSVGYRTSLMTVVNKKNFFCLSFSFSLSVSFCLCLCLSLSVFLSLSFSFCVFLSHSLCLLVTVYTLHSTMFQIPGGTIEESEVLRGIMINKDVVHPKMRR